jgi:hypothetical protein
MMEFLSSLFKPYDYKDYLENRALETGIKTGTAVTPVTQANTAMPWYITTTLVVVGGVLLYRYGAKLLKI